jgi:hypothetical protein
MNVSTRFKLLLAAMLLGGTLVLWPFMRRMHAIQACLDSGNVWDYSAHVCEPAVNPHPTISDSAATAPVEPRVMEEH